MISKIIEEIEQEVNNLKAAAELHIPYASSAARLEKYIEPLKEVQKNIESHTVPGKAIFVSPGLYEKLMVIAKELATQDNRCTASPYIFQVQEDEKVWDSSLNGDYGVFYHQDFTEKDYPFTLEGIKDYCDNNDTPLPDGFDTMDDDDLYLKPDIDYWMDKYCLQRNSYSFKPVYSNAFFTEKACKAHIQVNKHNLTHPVDYLSYCYRNPEMETMFEFFKSLHSQNSSHE